MADDTDEFSELRAADIDSVHTVGKAANGTTILFAKQAGDAEGVFGADFVRDMIAKGGDVDEGAPPNGITVTLDGAEITKAIHAAALRHAASVRKAGVQVAKDAFDGGDDAMQPGSPAWEGQDAEAAQAMIQQILAVIPGVKALAQRESTEVAAGASDDMDDMDDVCDLNQVCDALMCAAQMLAGFAVGESAEAQGPMAKAVPVPTDSAAVATPTTQENTVSTNADGAQTTTETVATDVAKAGTTLSETELAEIGRRFLLKKAAKGGKKKTSGAKTASDGARTIPGTDTVQAPDQGPDDVTKAEANQFATALAEVMAPVVKQLGELTAKVNDQGERVEKMAAQPDDRKSPMLNGATGEPTLAQRGSGITAHPEVQKILKSIEDMEDGPAKDTARHTLGYNAIKARFTPA
jgi:hypothetical protein